MFEALIFWYRNHRGEQGYRRVRPISIRFGASAWHTEPQWLMLGDELADDDTVIKQREYAMRDMQSFVGSSTVNCESRLMPLPQNFRRDLDGQGK
jgi:hypothetical protein